MTSADTVRLPNGKTLTRGRARALGLIDKNGDLTEKALADSQVAKQAARAQRSAEWRKSQGLPDVELNEDGTPKPTKRIEPLKPGNVDHDGNPITDPDLLAQIAARTAAIESGEAQAAQTQAFPDVLGDEPDVEVAEVLPGDIESGAVEGTEPLPDEVAEALAEGESLADIIQAHEEAKIAASEGEGDATDEG